MDYYQVGRWSVTPVSSGASTELPLSAPDLRGHLRLPSDTDDFVLQTKIDAAKQRIEGRTMRPLLRAQFDLAIDRFPCDGSPIRIPRMPLVSVDRVTWFNTADSSQDFGSSGWFADIYSQPGRLVLRYGSVWPTGTRYSLAGIIRFTAGYSTTPATGIPDPLVEAIRKLATELYENREAASLGNSVNEPLPYGLEEMLSDYVLPEFG